jgi:hypothetical protein
MEVTMPGGEVLKGRFIPDRCAGAGFESIHDAAYCANGASNKCVAHRGAASLIGAGSTSMQCEFYTKTSSGQMTGACRASRGTPRRTVEPAPAAVKHWACLQGDSLASRVPAFIAAVLNWPERD